MAFLIFKDGGTISEMEGCSFCRVHFLVTSFVCQFCMSVQAF